jgi:uncharacterized Zn finger protein (UPF0148 family)
MARCKKCGRKGLFLKIHEGTGLCPSCREAFAEKSRALTEKITAAKNEVSLSSDPKRILDLCQKVESYGEQLIALQLDYTLEPSQELIDLIEAYRKIGDLSKNK